MNRICAECESEESSWLCQCRQEPIQICSDWLSTHMSKLSMLNHLLQPIKVHSEVISFAWAEKENRKIYTKDRITERWNQLLKLAEYETEKIIKQISENMQLLKDRIDSVKEFNLEDLESQSKCMKADLDSIYQEVNDWPNSKSNSYRLIKHNYQDLSQDALVNAIDYKLTSKNSSAQVESMIENYFNPSNIKLSLAVMEFDLPEEEEEEIYPRAVWNKSANKFEENPGYKKKKNGIKQVPLVEDEKEDIKEAKEEKKRSKGALKESRLKQSQRIQGNKIHSYIHNDSLVANLSAEECQICNRNSRDKIFQGIRCHRRCKVCFDCAFEAVNKDESMCPGCSRHYSHRERQCIVSLHEKQQKENDEWKRQAEEHMTRFCAQLPAGEVVRGDGKIPCQHCRLTRSDQHIVPICDKGCLSCESCIDRYAKGLWQKCFICYSGSQTIFQNVAK